MSYTIGANEVTGQVAAEVREEFAFLGSLEEAHYIRLSLPYGPPSKDIEDISGLSRRPYWSSVAALISDLTDIQEVTNRPVVVPDFSDIDVDLRAEIHRCAALARGEEIQVEWDRIDVNLNDNATAEEGSDPVTLAAVTSLELAISGNVYHLGSRLIHYKIGRLDSIDTDGGGNRVAVYVPVGNSEATIRRVNDVE
jgi:hypothetical protein